MSNLFREGIDLNLTKSEKKKKIMYHEKIMKYFPTLS